MTGKEPSCDLPQEDAICAPVLMARSFRTFPARSLASLGGCSFKWILQSGETAARAVWKCFFVYKMLSPLFTRIWVFQLQLLPEAPLAQRLDAKPQKVKVLVLLQPLWQL